MSEIIKKSPTEVYRARVNAVKGKLPKNWRQVLYDNYPAYDTANNAAFVSNVYAGRTADITLTEIIERIASGELTLKDREAA